MMKESAMGLLKTTHEKKPLIHHITNTVTINDCANVTLAAGASPVMASAPEESGKMTLLADALVLNIGTLNENIFSAMIKAGRAANDKGIPVILDPVGVGATAFRTEKAKSLLQLINISIVRGNISEIASLLDVKAKTKGVDAGTVSMFSSELAKQAAKQWKSIVVISGKQDVISDGTSVFRVENGSSLLQSVTGTGCMSASLIGCMAGAGDDLLLAAIVGTSMMGIAGEIAEGTAEKKGLGTFKVHLMDAISLLTPETWKEREKIYESY
jgi:hydroxyethylthiazole kinase